MPPRRAARLVQGSMSARSAHIEGIFITPEAGAPMVDVNDAEVIAGRGIVGDRYFKRQGTYSVFRTSTKNVGKREPGRQITLVAAEGIEEALLVNAIPRFECLGDFRRNVVLRGVPAAELQAAAGREIKLGEEVVVLVHRWCVPCLYNERKCGMDGLMEATWEVAGVSCEVLRGGTIRVGDAVSVGETADPLRIDGGLADTDPGFLVRPSKRTKAMVEGSKARTNAMLSHLLKVDPGGVVRGLESYQSVGLQLFPRHRRHRKGEAMEKRFCTMVGIFVGLLALITVTQRLQKWWESRPLVYTPAPLPGLLCTYLPALPLCS